MARVLVGVLGVWSLLLLGSTVQRVQVWTSEFALWAEATEQSPQKPRVWINLGNQQQRRRDFAGARRSYRRAFAVASAGRSRDEQVLGQGIALANLAALEWDRGDRTQAVALIRQAAQIAPKVEGVQRLVTWMHAASSSP